MSRYYANMLEHYFKYLSFFQASDMDKMPRVMGIIKLEHLPVAAYTLAMEVPNDIKARYIKNRKKDLVGCLTLYNFHEYEKIERVGHQLKGNGSTFGYPELTKIGINLENAAQAHDIDSLKAALSDFKLWVKKVS